MCGGVDGSPLAPVAPNHKPHWMTDMARADLYADMMSAMTDVVLRRVEGCIKSMQPDTSATAPEHITGYAAGFRAAKREMLDLLDSET